jgi:hypothetical protein
MIIRVPLKESPWKWSNVTLSHGSSNKFSSIATTTHCSEFERYGYLPPAFFNDGTSLCTSKGDNTVSKTIDSSDKLMPPLKINLSFTFNKNIRLDSRSVTIDAINYINSLEWKQNKFIADIQKVSKTLCFLI